MTEEPAGPPDRLAGPALDARLWQPAAHPNARFTAPRHQCPSSTPTGTTRGACRSAPSFRRAPARVVPLVYQASTGTTASTSRRPWARRPRPPPRAGLGDVRRDPMAMLPFCGYNMADYFAHWLGSARERATAAHLQVNWFRKDDEAASSGPASARTARAQVGVPALRRRGGRGGHRDRGGPHARGHQR